MQEFVVLIIFMDLFCIAIAAGIALKIYFEISRNLPRLDHKNFCKIVN